MQLTTIVRRRDFLLFRLSTQVCPGFFFWLNVLFSLMLVCITFWGSAISGPMLMGGAVYFLSAWIFLVTINLVIAIFEAFLISALKRGVIGEHRFTLVEEGLIEETDVNRTVYAWRSVDKTRLIMGALMLRAGAGWHIFPRTTFNGTTTREQFLTAITTFKTRSTNAR